LTTAEQKALRLLVAGAVDVLEADGHRLVALVHGEHGTYRVEARAGRVPSCECASWRPACSHALAVRLVTR
jgi:uncharacterized Zn finger protein